MTTIHRYYWILSLKIFPLVCYEEEGKEEDVIQYSRRYFYIKQIFTLNDFNGNANISNYCY